LSDALSLQLFLIFAAIPFMFLAVLVEQQNRSRRALVDERSQLTEAQRSAHESEERFRRVADTAPVMIWMSSRDNHCVYVNQGWLEFTGRPIDAELKSGWTEGVHPEDTARCLNTYAQAFNRGEPFRIEYRLLRHDGQYRWILESGVPRFGAGGLFEGHIGSAIDVTERKLAEEALSTVNQKLIAGQEEERTRLARELHDDINQRLALLVVNLDRLAQGQAVAAELREEIKEVREHLSDLGSDIQALSHRLHSSKLEYLGLAAAAAAFCRELSERQGVDVDFRSENVPKDLSNEISLCLFRILQEGLQNAIRYSRARNFEVHLQAVPEQIELIVHDSGVGFDPEEALKGAGLGLISMKERVKLVNGTLSIVSRPGQGTTIRASVPMHFKTKSAGAAS
jgi:PAS domain S-box-containing protein